MAISELEDTLDQIIKTAKEINEQLEHKNKHPNAISLKDLSHYCTDRLLESTDSTEQFICFFLSSLIDSFFSNMGGDTPYDDELQNVRVSFYANMSGILMKLGEEIKKENREGLVDCLSKALNDYVNKINQLNTNYKLKKESYYAL